jgi:hypothetical protein
MAKRPYRLGAMTAAAVAVLVPQLITAPSSGALARGLVVPAGRFRFVAKLTMTDVPTKNGGTTTSACSGALISRSYVITAGHCFHGPYGRHVSGKVPYPTAVTVDTADVTSDAGITRHVVSVVQSSTADIALAKLRRKIWSAPPALISQRAPHVGEVLTMAGWGATSNVNPTPSSQLHWGEMKVTSFDSSTVGVTGYYPHANTSACLYDSGAPYFTGPYRHSPPVIYATESHGPACPHDQVETTARVDDIYAWIRSHVPDLPSGG